MALRETHYHWLPSLNFLSHLAVHFSQHQGSFAHLSVLQIWSLIHCKNINGPRSTISAGCHVTLIYRLSVWARCAANIHLTKSHRLVLIPACQPVSRDQLLFLSDCVDCSRWDQGLNYGLSRWHVGEMTRRSAAFAQMYICVMSTTLAHAYMTSLGFTKNNTSA